MTDTTREAVALAFLLGDRVTKVSGSKWTGRVVGFYSTALTPEGYAVESETEVGSVQIYPAKALALADPRPAQDAEGWVMVPKEPTQAMLDALEDGTDWGEGGWIGYNARDAYLIMLAVAPRTLEGK